MTDATFPRDSVQISPTFLTVGREGCAIDAISAVTVSRGAGPGVAAVAFAVLLLWPIATFVLVPPSLGFASTLLVALSGTAVGAALLLIGARFGRWVLSVRGASGTPLVGIARADRREIEEIRAAIEGAIAARG
ncbi:MAG: DUF6232 family protein [Pseudomonadota bacterium]